MGVKSTVKLTRKQAEDRYIELRINKIRRRLKSEAVLTSKWELENDLMILNDEAHDGEGFENYMIESEV